MENVKEPKGHCYLQWIFTLLANITLLMYGIECGWTSPITKYIQSDASPVGYPVSDATLGWIASSMSMSAIFGVLGYSFIVDTYGRRAGVILLAVPQAISWIIRLSYTSTTTIIIARVLSGLASGGCFNVVPMYVKEISRDDIRGTLSTLCSLFQTLGVFIIYIIGAYLDYHTVIYTVTGLPIVAVIVMSFAPESPAFLVKQGKIEEATKTVAVLRGLTKDDKVVQNVIEGMKQEDAYFRSLPNITYISLLRNRTWRKGIIMILITITLLELNGAFTIVTYASTILSSTGIEYDIAPEIQSLGFPAAMIISSLLVAIFVERLGRKPLLILAFILSTCCMFLMVIMIVLQMQGIKVIGWLPVVAMTLCVAMYSGGILPLSILIMTEMFSFEIRAKVMGFVVTYAWFLTFCVITIYTPMANYLGTYSPFIFYGAINLIGAIFSFVCLPETKGKSEEEILKIIMKDKNPKGTFTAELLEYY